MKTKNKYHRHYSKGLTTKHGGKCTILSVCISCKIKAGLREMFHFDMVDGKMSNVTRYFLCPAC